MHLLAELNYNVVVTMKALISIFLSIIFLVSPVQASEDTEELKKYVENLIDEGYKLVHDKKITESERHKKSSRLIRSHLYLDWMAKYTLGRNRRVIPALKIAEFAKIYSKFVVKVYADLSSNYNGEKAVLKNVKQIDDDMFIVNMEIVRPSGQQPIKIDYLVHKLANKTKDPYRIGDIITEGISILNSQQSEFNSVITSNGIDALIMDLEARVKKSEETAVKLK
jgi:phospholipid transport system substrate-binding protein